MSSPTRPVLRYFGGKWKLAPWIIQQLPPHKMYVEPFGGAASVLLRKQRVLNEVYNDLDENVVNIFRILRDQEQANELCKLCYLTPFSREDFEQSYSPIDEPLEKARRFIVRSFFGYGSKASSDTSMNGFRSRRKNSGTPAVDWRNSPDVIPAFAERLRGVVIEKVEATEVLWRYDAPDTLFYVDPPYVHGTRSMGKAKYYYELTDEDHSQLAAKLNEVEGMVALSGYNCELYQDIYKGWHKITRTHYAEQARQRVECLWLSPKAYEKRGGLLNVA